MCKTINDAGMKGMTDGNDAQCEQKQKGFQYLRTSTMYYYQQTSKTAGLYRRAVFFQSDNDADWMQVQSVHDDY